MNNNIINYKNFATNYSNNKKFPILIFDENWATKFPKEKKSKNIIKLEDNLKNKIKEEAKYFNDIKALKSLKNKYIYQIMALAERIQKDLNNSLLQHEMRHLEESLIEIKKQLLEAEENLINISDVIKEANFTLVVEVANICYNIMKKNQDELATIEPKITKTRKELAELVDKKIVLEEETNNTFYLLNSLIGSDMVDFLEDSIEGNQ